VATIVSTRLENAPKKAPISRKGAFRPDIQGLRALAVIAVIVDHLFNWPGGGFVGVDVFFVISGFLITGLMLREHERTGRISWKSFYRRRIKRIMPAAVLVMGVTVGVSYLVFLSNQFSSILSDAIWSALFLSNWHFAAIGTDYWQADGPISPLRHFWSLAVEEQFYIVWPILMVAIFALLAKRSPRIAKLALFTVMAALAVASFVWALNETATNPTVAYFSTFSRAWELALGSLLAVAGPLFGRMPEQLRTVLSYVGFAGIVASIFLISSTSAFPAPWAALPVVGSGLVIAAGIGGIPRWIPVLTNPVSVYLGKVSYSLYLWHFPVVIFFTTLAPSGTISFALWVLGITLYLSIASFHLVEDPIRRSSWLESRAKKNEARRSRQHRKHDSEQRWLGLRAEGTLGLLAVPTLAVTLLALGIGIPAPQVDPIAPVAATPLKSGAAEPTEAPSLGPASAALSKQISTSLTAQKWPALSPSTLTDTSADWPADEYGSCLVKDYSRPNACVFGPTAATKSIAVLGDSLGARLVYLVHKAYPEYRVYGFVRSGCISIDVQMTPRSAEDSAGCTADRASAIAATKQLSPDLVFIINNGGGVRELASRAQGTNASAEWATGLTKTISALGVDPAHVVVVAPPPEGKKLDQCATKVSQPSACVSTVSPDWMIASAGEIKGAAQAGAKYLNTLPWYCSPSKNCPSFVGTTIVKRDSVHPTAPFLDLLVDPLKESLKGVGITAS